MEQRGYPDKPNFFAFANDEADRKVIGDFASSHGWSESCVMQGNIVTAAQYFKTHPSPALLLVEIPSAEEAPKLLDELANVCDPGTKVIIIGMVNEYSFYCWLTDIGVFSYLLRPLTREMLDRAYQKSIDNNVPVVPTEKEPTKIISVVGARGGSGASTIALNFAGILAERTAKKIALVDIDPFEGDLSLILDIEPARGLRDVLERPDRIDQLFIDRVMSKVRDNLWVLSAEEQLKEPLEISEFAVDALLRELCNKYDVVVMDIPRRMRQFDRDCLKRSHNVLLVAELTLQSLRDTLRVSDLMKDALKMSQPMVVINRAGMAPKSEISVSDFEKGITMKISEKILYVPDIFMYIGSDIPSISHAKHAAMKPLYALAKQLFPASFPDEEVKGGGFFGFMKNTKKGG